MALGVISLLTRRTKGHLPFVNSGSRLRLMFVGGRPLAFPLAIDGDLETIMERQYLHLAATAFIAFGGLTSVLLLASYEQYSNILTAVFFAGSAGAVVNNYFRLSRIASQPESSAAELQRGAVTLQIYVSLFLSGMLGFVAYGLFLSGLLQGELFPKFSNISVRYVSLEQMLNGMAPEKNIDAAKALFWAFVAGFSERFIPNILDAIVIKAETGPKD